MADKFSGFTDSPTAPASQSSTVTPHDSDALASVSKAIYIGTGGNISVRLAGDSTDRVFTNLPNGSILPIRVTHIRATGTSAADLVALL